MTTHARQHEGLAGAIVKEDRKAHFLIFGTAFVMFLAIALVGQTLGWPWRSWFPGAEGATSVTGGVKAAVYTFMSHLQ